MPTGEAVIGSQQAYKIIEGIGDVGLWLQAIGVLAVVWIIFNIIDWIINSHRLKLLKKIMLDMQRIEDKISADIKRIEKKIDSLNKKR